MGYGWALTKDHKGRPYAVSAGVIPGSSAAIYRFDEGRINIIMLCNQQDVQTWAMGPTLAKLIYND